MTVAAAERSPSRKQERSTSAELVVVISPDLPRWQNLAARARPASRRALGWGWQLATTVLAEFVVTLISAYLLSSH